MIGLPRTASDKVRTISDVEYVEAMTIWPPSSQKADVSHPDRKNTEAIAYLLDQDRQRLQKSLGQSEWPWEPILEESAGQVAQELGSPSRLRCGLQTTTACVASVSALYLL